MTGRVDREGPIHRAIVQLLSLTLKRGAIFHHSPNEQAMVGAQRARDMAIMKAARLGTKPGWPDLEIIYDGKIYFLEVKADGDLSKAQEDRRDELSDAGAFWALVRSVEEAQIITKAWGIAK